MEVWFFFTQILSTCSLQCREREQQPGNCQVLLGFLRSLISMCRLHERATHLSLYTLFTTLTILLPTYYIHMHSYSTRAPQVFPHPPLRRICTTIEQWEPVATTITFIVINGKNEQLVFDLPLGHNYIMPIRGFHTQLVIGYARLE